MFVIFGVLGWARSWQVDVIDCQTTKDRKFNLHLIAGRYSSVVLQIVPVLGCSAATKHPDVRGGRPNPIGRLFVGGPSFPAREGVCSTGARLRPVQVCGCVLGRRGPLVRAQVFGTASGPVLRLEVLSRNSLEPCPMSFRLPRSACFLGRSVKNPVSLRCRT